MHSGAVTVPRELQALQHEQESLRRRQDHLETEELEIMEELDPLTEEVTGLDARLEALGQRGRARWPRPCCRPRSIWRRSSPR